MARSQSNLSIGSVSDTTLTTLYLVPSNSVVTSYLALNNTSGSNVDVDVYINDGSTDRVIETVNLKTGSKKQDFASLLSTQKLTEGFSVKIKLSIANTVNYFLSGSIIT